MLHLKQEHEKRANKGLKTCCEIFEFWFNERTALLVDTSSFIDLSVISYTNLVMESEIHFK